MHQIGAACLFLQIYGRFRSPQVFYTLCPTNAQRASAMDQLNEILTRAQSRAQELRLPYAGALLPAEAHTALQLAAAAKLPAHLVDVRTRAEWDWVGRIPGAEEIEWMTYPSNQPNGDFLAQLQEKLAPEAVVMFICRSGARSHNAASLASASGYAQSYNVLEGFEGDKDSFGHRNTVSGWRHAGLPWSA